MHGRDIVGLGREGFLAVAPMYTGDILWEHLEILLKGKLNFFKSDSITNSVITIIKNVLRIKFKRK